MNNVTPKIRNKVSTVTKERVESVLSEYAEGVPIENSIRSIGMSSRDFYRYLDLNPSVETEYRTIQRNIADKLIASCLELAAREPENMFDVAGIKVRAAVRMKIAGFFDRKRYGERITTEHEVGPDLLAAIGAAKQRVALSARDLETLTHVEHVVIEQVAPDIKSVFNEETLDESHVFGP